MTTPLTAHPALAEWVSQPDPAVVRALIRRVFILAQQGDLTDNAAASVLCAAGIGATEQQVEDAGRWLDTIDDPSTASDRIAHGEGVPWRDDLRDAVLRAAQDDLDDLITRLTADAVGPRAQAAAVSATLTALGL